MKKPHKSKQTPAQLDQEAKELFAVADKMERIANPPCKDFDQWLRRMPKNLAGKMEQTVSVNLTLPLAAWTEIARIAAYHGVKVDQVVSEAIANAADVFDMANEIPYDAEEKAGIVDSPRRLFN